MTCPSDDRQAALKHIGERWKYERAAGQGYAAAHYSKEELDRICDLAGVTEENNRHFLSVKLVHATTWLITDLRSRDKPAPSEAEQEFRKIENALDRVLRALGLNETDDPEDGMPLGPVRDHLEYLLGGHEGPTGEQGLRLLITGVGHLRDIARAARLDTAQDKGKGEHRGDEALNDFIGRLLEAYGTAGGNPSLTRRPESGEPGGRTLNFLSACLDLIKNNHSEVAHLIPDQSKEALASRISRIRRSVKSEMHP
jgi:hypothetical protein